MIEIGVHLRRGQDDSQRRNHADTNRSGDALRGGFLPEQKHDDRRQVGRSRNGKCPADEERHVHSFEDNPQTNGKNSNNDGGDLTRFHLLRIGHLHAEIMIDQVMRHCTGRSDDQTGNGSEHGRKRNRGDDREQHNAEGLRQ